MHCIFDNPITQVRELYVNRELKQVHPRHECVKDNSQGKSPVRPLSDRDWADCAVNGDFRALPAWLALMVNIRMRWQLYSPC